LVAFLDDVVVITGARVDIFVYTTYG